MYTKLITAGIILSISIGLYIRHSYLIASLEEERIKNVELLKELQTSQKELKQIKEIIEIERRLSNIKVQESKRISNVLTIERDIIKEIKAECLDISMPDDIIRMFKQPSDSN